MSASTVSEFIAETATVVTGPGPETVKTMAYLDKILLLSTRHRDVSHVFDQVVEEFLGPTTRSDRLIYGGIYAMQDSKENRDAVRFIGVTDKKTEELVSKKPVPLSSLGEDLVYSFESVDEDDKIYSFYAYPYKERLAIGSSADRITFRPLLVGLEEMKRATELVKVSFTVVEASLRPGEEVHVKVKIAFPKDLEKKARERLTRSVLTDLAFRSQNMKTVEKAADGSFVVEAPLDEFMAVLSPLKGTTRILVDVGPEDLKKMAHAKITAKMGSAELPTEAVSTPVRSA